MRVLVHAARRSPASGWSTCSAATCTARRLAGVASAAALLCLRGLHHLRHRRAAREDHDGAAARARPAGHGPPALGHDRRVHRPVHADLAAGRSSRPSPPSPRSRRCSAERGTQAAGRWSASPSAGSSPRSRSSASTSRSGSSQVFFDDFVLHQPAATPSRPGLADDLERAWRRHRRRLRLASCGLVIVGLGLARAGSAVVALARRRRRTPLRPRPWSLFAVATSSWACSGRSRRSTAGRTRSDRAARSPRSASAASSRCSPAGCRPAVASAGADAGLGAGRHRAVGVDWSLTNRDDDARRAARRRRRA